MSWSWNFRPAPPEALSIGDAMRVLRAVGYEPTIRASKPTGFAAMPPERRQEVARMGAEASNPKGVIRKPRVHFGLTAEEFHSYGVIRAKGFSQHEAADIVIRSRRSAPPSEA